jgi:hypothetical protein
MFILNHPSGIPKANEESPELNQRRRKSPLSPFPLLYACRRDGARNEKDFAIKRWGNGHYEKYGKYGMHGKEWISGAWISHREKAACLFMPWMRD